MQHLSVFQGDHPAGFLHHALIVCGKDECDPFVAVQFFHDVEEVGGGNGVAEALAGTARPRQRRIVNFLNISGL